MVREFEKLVEFIELSNLYQDLAEETLESINFDSSPTDNHKQILFFIYLENSLDSLAQNTYQIFEKELDKSELWQHFQGIEIETPKNIFDEEIINLMDFNCDQKKDVHFFYTLPFSKNRALIETTWLSNLEDQSLRDYDLQLENYIENNLGIKNYKINFTEKGAIPLFSPSLRNNNNIINIGSAGGMTRLSTGYTFLNIQEHSRYILKNIDNIDKAKIFSLGKKYQFLDKVFLRVLEKHPEKMPKIFFNMFRTSSNTIIKFLSNKSNMIEDINIISKMPKLIFLKALFN